MAVGYQINIPLPEPQSGMVFAALAAAVRHAGEIQVQSWMRKASGELVDRLTGDYIAGLRQAESVRYPYDGDQFTIGVFNVARHAPIIEYGHGAFNLAQRIRWGSTPKSRPTKDGTSWYIIVPFRHFTPHRLGEGASPGRIQRSMPASIYAIAKHLAERERLTFKGGALAAQTGTISHRGRVVAARGIGHGRPEDHPLGFHPGGRIIQATSKAAGRASQRPSRTIDVGGRTVTQHHGHAKSPRSIAAAVVAARENGGGAPSPFRVERSVYEGMIRSGAKGHSQYMTFRVITPRSNWMIPARRPAWVARAVAEETAPIIRALFEKAWKADIERGFAAALRG